ncbi:DUF4252 domain-containing protein [Cellulophaga baltica]|uniref:DUF4252 domain-containing protein n=1 Tax=Cellulophaga TaxID=104264 RepID=UPI001C0658D9|nr:MULTISPECIES: DUF4252 domain-containing protein [Cellulophaga]MBU2997419.1 DUF4252 domain-containing protein [Cellulophaga baltica]MDO6768816.1 DUF4252 domain-containing protein [Cellulophaga sp. 1_MG-2023]
MKKYILSFVIAGVLLLSSCSSKETLQEYFVANTENPNFISFDLPASLLNINSDDLSAKQEEALSSLKKLNVLAFKKSVENTADFTIEKEKVKAILKGEEYQELMKMNTKFGKATIKFLGDDEAIDEIVIYGDSSDKGFVIVRVLGNNMKPENLIEFINTLEKSNVDGKKIESLAKMFQ